MSEVKIDQKFLDKVKKNENGCLEWIGCLSWNGYGQLKRKGKHFRAHRYIFELKYGLLKKGECVLHKCDNPKCVNLDHLFKGTTKENTRDMCLKGRHNCGKGERQGFAKLTEQDVLKIREFYRKGIFTQVTLSKMFGVRQDNISRIVNRKLWKHLLADQLN